MKDNERKQMALQSLGLDPPPAGNQGNPQWEGPRSMDSLLMQSVFSQICVAFYLFIALLCLF